MCDQLVLLGREGTANTGARGGERGGEKNELHAAAIIVCPVFYWATLISSDNEVKSSLGLGATLNGIYFGTENWSSIYALIHPPYYSP